MSDESAHPLDGEEIDELTVSQLIELDPLKLSDQQIETIVYHLRAARTRWENTQRKQKKDNPTGRTSRRAGGTKEPKKKLKSDEKDDVLASLFD